MTQAGIALDAAKIGLDAAEELLNIKKKVVEAQLAILSKAKDIIVRHPELINGQASLLIQQTKLAAEAVAEAARIANEVDKEIDGIQRRIDGLHGRIASLACYLLVYPPAIRKCRDAVARIAAEIQRLRDDITRAGDRRRFAQEAADAAKRLKDEIKERLDKLKAELDEATRGIAEGTYVAAVEVANAEQRAQEEVVKESQKAVEQAKQFIAELEKKLDELARVTRPIRTALEQLNPITLLIRNWLRDVGIAAEEYIKASHRAGLLMLRSEGNPLKEYTEWYSCYGQVFLAIPKEVGQIGCLSKRYLKEISDAYDRFLGGLPEVLQWLIDPGRKVRRIVEKPVKEALEDAGIKLVGFLTDKRTAEFIELLTHPKTADRNHLNEIYGRDESGKNFIVFDEVAEIVDKDLAISSGQLDVNRFAPLRHSVTMAKLALLEGRELNRLVRDIVGEESASRRPIFSEVGGNDSILIGVVRSLDGNHQWQGYGLPYPKRLGVAHESPHRFHYGHDGHAQPGKGLVIWTDEFLREKVFYRLFPDPVIGNLQQKSELRWSSYKFPSCPQNPFPSTQDRNGEVQFSDATCAAVSNPAARIGETTPETRVEYHERFFRCGQAASGAYYTIAGPFRNEGIARSVAGRLSDQFPDMHVEVWRPYRQTTYWPVVLAACVPMEVAVMARDIGLRRRVEDQITVDRASLPWLPVSSRSTSPEQPARTYRPRPSAEPERQCTSCCIAPGYGLPAR